MSLQSDWITPTLFAAMMFGLSGVDAKAQFANRPFQFNTSGPSGLGMSIGGKQAILNQQLYGETPRTLWRDYSGQLLDVQLGMGRIPIISAPNGQVLPGYRRSFRDRSPGLAAGVFNANFAPGYRSSSNAEYLFDDMSSASVDTWTGHVLNSGSAGYSYGAGDPVSSWTGFVYALGPIGVCIQR